MFFLKCLLSAPEYYMDSIFNQYDWKAWEKFCERMLTFEFGHNNIFPVPDGDEGDLGIEFYTVDGTIYQCYCPDPSYSMKEYKSHIQDKITTDILKLEKYQKEITTTLAGIMINKWILLIPDYKSRQLIIHCNKYREIIKSKNLPFIDNDNFSVMCQDPDRYPKGKILALRYADDLIKVDSKHVTDEDIASLKDSRYEHNIQRKSNLLTDKSDRFAKNMLEKYISLTKFLDDLRSSYPDIYGQIEDCARVLLGRAKEMVEIENQAADLNFIREIRKENEKLLDQLFRDKLHSLNLSDLPYGFVARWLAECNMDFINE